MKVLYTDINTGLPKSSILKPYGRLMYHWGKCASYDLKDYEEQIRHVIIKTPLKVDVILHRKDQSSIPKELSMKQRFDGNHEVTVTVEKTIDVTQLKKPCYKPEDHNGETYNELDYKLLNKIIMQRFNCTSPFIPSEFRTGSEICLKPNRSLHTFIESSSASFCTIMWKKNYHSIPPCVYHTYSAQETRTEGK